VRRQDNIATMVQDYNYTIPRRPIAAMFASPGPALYTMPTLVGRTLHDPRSVHVRYPAYSMASRVYMHKQDQSPGPKYFPLAKVRHSAHISHILHTQAAWMVILLLVVHKTSE